MQGNTDDVIIGVVAVLVIALMVFFAIATALNERTRSVFVGMVLASVLWEQSRRRFTGCFSTTS